MVVRGKRQSRSFLDELREREYTSERFLSHRLPGQTLMREDRIAILLNPAAGKGRAGRARFRLEKLLRQLGIPFDLCLTQHEKDLKSLTREMGSRYRTLVGAGGDSTFQIMVDELMKTESRPRFGLIGLGSSNDIAREIGVDTLKKACLALKKGQTRAVDIGCLGDGDRALLYFLGQANIGLGVAVNQRVERFLWHTPWLGKRQSLAGLLAIMKAYQERKIPVPLEIKSATGKVKGEFTAVVFSNIRYWATGRMISPGARVDDGSLDACLIQRCSFRRLVRLTNLARTGKHGRAREVAFLRSPVFEVRSEQPFAIQADGEILGGWSSPSLFRKVQLETIPRALAIIHGDDPR